MSSLWCKFCQYKNRHCNYSRDEKNKAKMSNNCERLVFQGVDAYPQGTFRYTDASKLGRYVFIMMKLNSLTGSITDHGLLVLELLSQLKMAQS